MRSVPSCNRKSDLVHNEYTRTKAKNFCWEEKKGSIVQFFKDILRFSKSGIEKVK